MIAHESSSPSGRKYFGLLRSETEPIRNFETPYAIDDPVSAQPRSAFEYSRILRQDVGDREREVVADEIVRRVAGEDAGEHAAGDVRAVLAARQCESATPRRARRSIRRQVIPIPNP